MIGFLSKLFGGNKSDKDVKRIQPLVTEINRIYGELQSLSHNQLRNKTHEFRQRIREHLKKDERLRIEWADGYESTYPLTWLRQMCPCASCRMLRTGSDPHQLLQSAPSPDLAEPDVDERASRRSLDTEAKPGRERRSRPRSLSLSVLPSQFVSATDAVHVTHAELVGNYALKLDWSDGHTSGIYSFAYLREIAVA